jgi:hypothetical protein
MAKCVSGAITASTRADAKDERSMLKPNVGVDRAVVLLARRSLEVRVDDRYALDDVRDQAVVPFMRRAIIDKEKPREEMRGLSWLRSWRSLGMLVDY